MSDRYYREAVLHSLIAGESFASLKRYRQPRPAIVGAMAMWLIYSAMASINLYKNRGLTWQSSVNIGGISLLWDAGVNLFGRRNPLEFLWVER